VCASGVNPGEVKKRTDWMGFGIGYPRVVPHSDGAGTIEGVGVGVSPSRVGERVWVWGAQSGRPFGTAAEYTAVPEAQAVRLPDGVGFGLGPPSASPHARPTAAFSPTGPFRVRRCLWRERPGRWGASPSRSRSGEGPR
jgi:NADPH:quinone reductase